MNGPNRRVILLGLALATIALSTASLLRKPSPPDAVSAAVESFYDRLILQVDLLTAELKPGSQVVALVVFGEFEHGAKARYQRVFQTLKDKGIKVRKIERLLEKPEEGALGNVLGFPMREYLRVAEENPEADAILSFCGLPFGSVNPQQKGLSQRPPLLLTRVNHWTPALQAMIEEGLVSGVVFPTKADKNAAFTVLRRP